MLYWYYTPVSAQILFEVYQSTGGFSGSFDTVIYNIGNGWVKNSNYFKAPQAGIYYFSFSVGTVQNMWAWTSLKVGSVKYCENEIAQTVAGTDIASRGCMLSLLSGNTVKVFPDDNGDSSVGESSFKGFLYSPILGSGVVWSTHTSSEFTNFTGIIPYDTVLVRNPTSVWQAATYTIVIPAGATGTYYVEIVGQSAHYLPIDMELRLNGNTLLTRLLLAYGSYYVTRARAILTHLAAGDQVNVMCYYCDMTGDGTTGISFMGMLLYPG